MKERIFKPENTLFVSVSRGRFPERFWETEKELPFKEWKYRLDPELEPQGRWDLLFIVIESFQHPQVLQLYLLKDVPFKKEPPQGPPKESLLIFDLAKFSEKKLFDLSYHDDLGGLLEKALVFFQNHRDEEGRIYGVGRLSFLLEHSPEALEELKDKVEKRLTEFSLRVKPLKLVFGAMDLPPEVLTRHFIVLGETGSGKTFSVLKPVMEALARRAGDFAALVIDPKLQELKQIFQNALPKKKAGVLVDVFAKAQKGLRIDLFEGLRDRSFEERLSYLFRMSPAFQRQTQATNDAFWPNAARIFIQSLFRLDYAIRKKFSNKDLFSFFQEFVKQILQKDPAPAIKYLLERYQINVNKPYFQKLRAFKDWLWELHMICYDGACSAIFSVVNEELNQEKLPEIEFWGKTPKDTFSSILAVAEPFFKDWTNPVAEAVLWSDPFDKPPEGQTLSLRKAILAKKVLFFSFPKANLSEHHYRLGQILKNKYFAFAYDTYSERCQEGQMVPIFYVADEFHRFITGDETSGEQSFLDRCRAYGVSCLMATQSISSLKYGLAENTENTQGESLNYALEIILNNCGTKFFFRTTDAETNEKLKAILPGPPNPALQELGHVIEAFPLSLLSVGECYFLTPKGTWGRTKIVVE